MGRMTIVAAFAGVHGGDKLKVTGIGRTAGRPADGNLPVLQRLTQDLEAFPGKLGQFIEEQHAAVGKTALAGAELRTAAG